MTNVALYRFEESLEISLNITGWPALTKDSKTVHHIVSLQVQIKEGSFGP